MRIPERRKVNVLDMKCFRSLVGVLFGIHLPGTELPYDPFWMGFSTGLFQAVFIWLSIEFSIGHRDQQM